MEFLAENKQYSAEQIEIILFQIKKENINGIKLIKMLSYYFFVTCWCNVRLLDSPRWNFTNII